MIHHHIQNRAAWDARWLPVFACVLSVAMFAGCAADQSSRENLSAGFNSLQNPSREDDLSDSLSRADAQISKDSHGQGAAEAFYLRGRALEQRVKRSDEQGRSDLLAARQAYGEALSHNPAPQLQQYIHTSLGNVCYWLDDYTTAISEWQQVAGKTSDETLNAFTLYRIGLCQQRLGNFSAADRTFTDVAQKYPNAEAAIRAQQHIGYKFFSVQLATFADARMAESSVQQLSREGVSPKHQTDRAGRHIVTIGPASNYVQAEQLKARFASRFPDAVIVP